MLLRYNKSLDYKDRDVIDMKEGRVMRTMGKIGESDGSLKDD